MGFRFQRRIKILPGLAINLSKSGVGFSVGGRGFHAGIDAKGRRYTSASLPGTGISWREYHKTQPHSAAHPPPMLPAAPVSTSGSRVVKNVVLTIVLALLAATLVAIVTHLY
jgi:hypothetical protein